MQICEKEPALTNFLVPKSATILVVAASNSLGKTHNKAGLVDDITDKTTVHCKL